MLGEHTMRMSGDMYDASVAAGRLCLEVLVCTDLHAFGCERPLEEMAMIDLCSDVGAQVTATST